MGQLQLDEELGKGNYGTVKKVLHKPTKVAMAMKVRFTRADPRRYWLNSDDRRKYVSS